MTETCDNCGAQVEYQPSDVLSERERDQSGDVSTYRWVVCPKCGTKVYVD